MLTPKGQLWQRGEDMVPFDPYTVSDSLAPVDAKLGLGKASRIPGSDAAADGVALQPVYRDSGTVAPTGLLC